MRFTFPFYNSCSLDKRGTVNYLEIFVNAFLNSIAKWGGKRKSRKMSPKSESELSLEDEWAGFIKRGREAGIEVNENDILIEKKEIEIQHLIPSHEVLWNPGKELQEQFKHSYKKAKEKMKDSEPFVVAEIIVITEGKDRERYFILDGNGRWMWCLGNKQPYEKIEASSICLKNRYQYKIRISELLKAGTKPTLIKQGKPCRYNYLRYWILEPSLSKMEEFLVPKNDNPHNKYEKTRLNAFTQFTKVFRSEETLWKSFDLRELL